MSDTPLYDALSAHLAAGRASFHTPGHKGMPSPLHALGDLLLLDLTELPDTDSLFEADGPIALAMERATRLFGSKRTLFSAGGCTLCIQAMLRLAAPGGGKVVFGRTIHRAAVNAMALLDIDPVWLLPRRDAGPGLPGRIRPLDVKAALTAHPDAQAVYITSPDYYGVMSDVGGIAAVCRAFNVPLLVDNAHGAHLSLLGDHFHPLQLGASATADSAHKTLPVLTGGAYLQIGDETLCRDDPLDAMSLFGSTSPSYPVMASLDICRRWMEVEGPAAFTTLKGRVAFGKTHAASLGIGLPEGPVDPVRITLDTSLVGVSGNDAAQLLRTAGIEPEFSDGRRVVLLPSPFNPPEHFDRLHAALDKLPLGSPLDVEEGPLRCPDRAFSVREAVLGKGEWVGVNEALGRVSMQAACPCPPGVPAVMPGEIIDSSVQKSLLTYGIFRIKVLK